MSQLSLATRGPHMPHSLQVPQPPGTPVLYAHPPHSASARSFEGCSWSNCNLGIKGCRRGQPNSIRGSAASWPLAKLTLPCLGMAIMSWNVQFPVKKKRGGEADGVMTREGEYPWCPPSSLSTASSASPYRLFPTHHNCNHLFSP